ncbi:MAG TPA: hypothetical protein VF618_12980 [Thermoanaerobaculia bacterium]
MTPLPDPPHDSEALYDLYVPQLIKYAVEELHLSRRVAESLAHGVLLASLHQLPTVTDVTSWLKGAMGVAARSRQ